MLWFILLNPIHDPLMFFFSFIYHQVNDTYRVTSILVPAQQGTPNQCTIQEPLRYEQVSDYDLPGTILLGWIHLSRIFILQII